MVILLTGVGFDHLLSMAQRHVRRQRFLDALADTITIARGPKPTFAMREVGVFPTHAVDKPNTWREILTTIDQHVTVDNQVVAVQEYGQPNTSLVAGLEARGARVMSVSVYRWELPKDRGPLEKNVRRLADGQLDVVLFTSAIQVSHLLKVARQLDLEQPLRQSLGRTVVASIGPTTSEMLRSQALPVDFEPTLSRMGHFVRQVALHAHALRDRKLQLVDRILAVESPPVDEQTPWHDSLFMRACRREPTSVTPIWLMRQAGRYMAEYREVRAKVSFLELCKDPALCSEVMCTAVKRLGVDAAIIFSDLLPILEPMGLDLEFAVGGGPVVHNPVREPLDVDRVLELESVDALHFVMETVRQTRRDLPGASARHWLCRRTVYAGQLHDRRWGQPQLPAHQDAHVSRSRRLAVTDAAIRPRRDQISQRADCCRSASGAVVRLLGRLFECRRLSSLRAPLCPTDYCRHRARRAGDQFCHRQSDAQRAVGRGWEQRGGSRLAHAAR